MKVYLDNSATTYVSDEVLNVMLPYFKGTFGNPSSLHAYGREAQYAVDKARDAVANILGCKAQEIYFTSGGTESNNWAIRGAVASSKFDKKHIVTTAIEHPAVLDTCKELSKNGVNITYVGVDKSGIVSAEDIKKAVTKNTCLVTVMLANNEIGTIQPIKEIGEFCKKNGILFHTDAVQAVNSIDLNISSLNVDMLSLSAHKFHGPKGVGVLYIKQGKNIGKILSGGAQERNKRAGTTNTPAIVGLAKALEIAVAKREEKNTRLKSLRDYFVDRVISEIPNCYLNGCTKKRLPFNANISFEFVEGESILMLLDLKGIAVSSGSACASNALEPSHVIKALGVKEELAHSSIRFTLGTDTVKEELDYTVDVLKESIEKLRAMSPLFKQSYNKGEFV